MTNKTAIGFLLAGVTAITFAACTNSGNTAETQITSPAAATETGDDTVSKNGNEIDLIEDGKAQMPDDPEEILQKNGKITVEGSIPAESITDFYYTVSNINYDAFYQRYRFFTEDGKHLFFHETRERKDDYGPATEDDTTAIGTVELTNGQWSEFYDHICNGTVKAREETADAGGSGPWMYLYWNGDKSKYQEYYFASSGAQLKFVDFCVSLIPDPAQ